MKNILLLIPCYLIFSTILFADNLNVPQDYATIQEAINAAQHGDMVLVAEGTYMENINFKGKAITVASHYILDQDTSHISATIIDGSQRSHPDSGSVVYFISGEDTTSVLYGLTITGGTGTVAFAGGPLARVGGGIFINNANAKISDNIIFNNTVADSSAVIGGGLVVFPPFSDTFVIVENNTFSSNSSIRSKSASEGGGMFVCNKARICNNIISNNFVSSDSGEAFGGGIVAAFTLDSILIYNNKIIYNKVETLYGTGPIDGALGGGFMVWNDMTSYVRIVNNIVANNEVSSSIWSAGAGGCFEDVGGDILFSNNLVLNNSYSGTVDCHGTAIGIQDNTVLGLINNTITGNESSPNGGALSTWNTISTKAMNNILWGNSAGTSKPEIAVWEGEPADIVYSNIQGGWNGEGNIDVNPLFTDSLFHLSDSSQCIGAGSASYNISGAMLTAPEDDFEGNIRPNPAASRPDMGAMENERAVPLLSAIQIPDDYETIQAGVDAAEEGDTVLVAEGTYYENIIIQSKAITLASYFLIDGDTSHISGTVIDGSQPVNSDTASVVTILNSPDASVLCGFTITGGGGHKNIFGESFVARGGGGIQILGSSATITNNHIINNVINDRYNPEGIDGAQGGGILFTSISPVSGLTLNLSNNLIAGNRVESAMTGGGALSIDYPHKDITLNYIIEKNIIKDNTIINTDDWKAMGGGIFLGFYLPTDGTQIIRNNIISNNRAYCNTLSKHSFGGGLYIIIMDTEDDGAIDNDPGPYIYNNLITGNHSDYLGGGIAVWRTNYTGGSPAISLPSAGNYVPKPSFINNTIVNNTALDGSGFYIMNHKPFLMNNIIWNISPEDAVWGEIFLGNEPQWTDWVEPNKYGDAEIYYTDIQGGWDKGQGNKNIDPLFILGDSLYRLTDTGDTSMCLNAGIDSIEINGTSYGAPSTDYAGKPRPQPSETPPDMGAWESDVVNSLEQLNDLPFPKSIALKQNYPNPFNPLTTIDFSIPKTEFVSLKIYNLLGQQFITLVSGKLKAGNYQYKWDASGFASGIYYYRLSTESGFVKTRKLVLLK